MPLTNEQILEKAIKSITVANLGNSVLQPEKFNQFVRGVQEKANILNEARFIEMDSPMTDIDRVGFAGRVLKAGTDDQGDHRTAGAGDKTKPVFKTNRLTAKELIAVTGIKDKAMRRNIEREDFEQTLIDMFSASAGKDLEEFCLLADTDITYAHDDVLSLTDGWAKRADNKLYGVDQTGEEGEDKDFDPADVEDLFDKMILALPKRFLDDPGEWRFWVPFEVYDKYVDKLKSRETGLGDKAMTEAGSVKYKGFPVVYSPMIERSKAVGENGAGRVALLSHPDNMVWGLFHEITVEPDRQPMDRSTDFILTLEGDSHFEDEEGAVVAFLDQEKPAEEGE